MTEKLSCHVVRDLLPQYAEHLLTPESEEAVRAHLEECADCRGIFEEMTFKEPSPEAGAREVDYLKKVRRGKRLLLLGAVLAVAAVAACIPLHAKAQAKKTVVNYDEASRTIVVYGREGDTDLTLPEAVGDAKNLDAQYESFRLTAELDLLRTEGQPLDDYLSAYLNRTNQSMQFLRSYLKEHCADRYPAERAAKYVEFSVLSDGDYVWTELPDRITLETGSFYWHREELYVLALLGSRNVEWKQLGYAWYLGACVDPYGEVLATSRFDEIDRQPYGEAYRRAGGTDEATPENYRLLNDAVSYVCLTKTGRNWGTAYECMPLKDTALYRGPKKSIDPGNDMSVCMATSFIAYLSDRYGFEKVSGFCFGQAGFEESFGTDYESAYGDWSERILATFGEAG